MCCQPDIWVPRSSPTRFATPFVGEFDDLAVGWLLVDNPTLNRFFSLHYLLPFVRLSLGSYICCWCREMAIHGCQRQGSQDTVPFHPYYRMMDVSIVVFMIRRSRFTFFVPIILAAVNYLPAIRWPQWPTSFRNGTICRSQSQLSRQAACVVAMLGSILILFFLPWFDTSRVRSGTYRQSSQILLGVCIVCVALGYLGSKPAEGAYVFWSRILTAYYFLHFIVILPLLGLLESPKPLPPSISDAVLAKKKPLAPAE
jgi:ubiquinol-cytochrome c reductase cytochrome b subunit